MTDYRFDSLMQVKTPAEWVEKAVSIPRSRRKPLLSRRGVHAAAAAAALVFAAGWSVFLFMATGQSPLPAVPVSTTAAADSTAPTFTTPEGAVYVTTPQGETQPVTGADGEPVTVPPTMFAFLTTAGGHGATVPRTTAATAPTASIPSATTSPAASSPSVTTAPAPTEQTEPPEPSETEPEASTGDVPPIDPPWIEEPTEEPDTESPSTELPWIEDDTTAVSPSAEIVATITFTDSDGVFGGVRRLQCTIVNARYRSSFVMINDGSNTYRRTLTLYEGWYYIRVFDGSGNERHFSSVLITDGAQIYL